MDSLYTEPADIEPADPASPWQQFRVQHPTRRNALLRHLLAGNAAVTVASGRQPLFRLPVWSMDLQRNSISLWGNSGHVDKPLPAPPRLLWGVSYLDRCKIQFALRDAQWQQGGGMWLLRASLPDAVFALQRRGSTRLRLPAHSAPAVYLPLPGGAVEPTSMLALNIHAEGCALWKPRIDLPLKPGMVVQAVEVQLDDAHILVANLQVLHVTRQQGAQAGTRVGCTWQAMTDGASHTLATWLARRRQCRGPLQRLFDAP